MKKLLTLILIMISLLTFTACGGSDEENDNPVPPTNVPVVPPTDGVPTIPSTDGIPTELPTPVVKEYTIEWLGYDGTVLETDIVKEGEIPTYDGATPLKPSTGTSENIFTGWTPEVVAATCDASYTATFILYELNPGDVDGKYPHVSSDNKTITYGIYPQTHVNDANLISELETLTPSDVNGWYFYQGEYYAKEVANVYQGENYTFDDGEAIISGNTYWFKCEPISWDILSNENGIYYLVTSKLIDAHSYYNNYNNRNENNQLIYANNYEYSDIRTWLNNYFYNNAFALNNVFIKESNLDNSSKTSDSTDNKYSCSNTLDKVFLPTYEDYLNSSYGFNANSGISDTRECKTTDYARARGAWYNDTNANLKYNGSYWTRTATSEYSYCAWNVNSGGFLSTYAVDGTSHCVRPSIYIYFQ